MRSLHALGSGLTGALALTAVHETARKNLSDAPRMDILASRAIARSLEALGREKPLEERLYEAALIGDVLSNSLYYSLVGLGPADGAIRRGAMLGLAAGVGAVVLPPLLGLGSAPSRRTKPTEAMTVGWYLLGGLVAGIAYQATAK
jgi:hypothetical protein